MGQLTFNLQPERRIYSVSDLTARIRDLLAKNFTDVIVHGEISNCREAGSGHIYFTLKDERAQVRCVFFKQQQRGMKFRPEDGMKVSVRGSISVYEARGEYQIYVEVLEPLGRGALQLAFEQLKKRLEAEGLFDSARKKPLPMLPRRIGLITSPTGAAVRDVVRILTRRFPNVCLTLYPVRVQGEGAAAEIVTALDYFHAKQAADVILLVRGGGSLEDLWAFNEEPVARAIAACSIAVISGVGHETDFTIADFVADVRASTPSAAAELVLQTRREFDKHVYDLRARLEGSMHYRLLELSNRVNELAGRRGFRRPLDILRQQRQRSDDLTSRLAVGLRSRLESSRKRYTKAHLGVASFDFRAKLSELRLQLQKQNSQLAKGLQARLEISRRRFTKAHLGVASFDFRAKLSELRLQLQRQNSQLAKGLQARLEISRKRFTKAHLAVASFDFRAKIAAFRLLLQRRTADFAKRADNTLRIKRKRWEQWSLLLEERSPLKVLERGYAIATDAAGNVLRDGDQVSIGAVVNIQLHRGRLATEVKKKEVKKKES